ncbi:MAG TPA: 16S rRNA (uracil(1498)-N(3))-methyltransferase [Desulfobulbus sp.]|nr:16S rRNA (uracil(1498)-N(3))-methyltransferase [Desulfobulbus sp.]
MNLLLFAEDELRDGRLRLSGRRAGHIRTILRLQPGDTLRLGMINGRRGEGRILRMSGQEVELRVRLDHEPPPRPSLELILALPRPIMLQRILKQATVMGVARIHLVRASRVEKSFFHTPVLRPEKIRSLLVEGLEQAMDTRLPGVEVHHRFRPFVEDVVPGLAGRRLLAHPGVRSGLADVFARRRADGEGILLAVGPEGGWSDYEVERFREQGFAAFSMGPRILHVDTAVVALLAQLQLLDDLEKRYDLEKR